MAIIFVPRLMNNLDYRQLHEIGKVVEVFPNITHIFGEGASTQRVVDVGIERIDQVLNAEENKDEEVYLALSGDYTQIALCSAILADRLEGELKMLKFERRVGLTGGYVRVSYKTW